VLIFVFQSKNLTSRWVAVLLIEVPVMLSVCNVCNQTHGWFGRAVV
jgi:hypothetical protein